uniref:39S ribosomal protein L41, mitochondrial n=1 Tax=Aceria tosichella TaxID=561515 RepID=A0A6G1SAG3_9ACAR
MWPIKRAASLLRSTELNHHAGGASQRILSLRWFHGNPAGEDPIKNFEDFKIPNQIGTFEHHKLPQDLLENEYNYPVCRDTMGIRWPGYWFKRKFVYVKEMEPELIVPDLTGFQLRPYVSYRTEDVQTKPFTAKELFDKVYANEVERSFKENNIENFDVPSEKIDEARLKALQTGADLFEDHPLDGVRAPIEYTKDI